MDVACSLDAEDPMKTSQVHDLVRNGFGRIAHLAQVRPKAYGRRPALVLINGLAEQAESWYKNHRFWRRHFDVHMPNLIAYGGDVLHRRIESGQPISVDYLVEKLHGYLEEFAQSPPYHLVASSLGGKIAVEYALRYPHRVSRLVLLCPSGLGDVEQLPIVEGVRRNDYRSLIESVFANPRHVEPEMVSYYARSFANRRWRTGILRTIRGTMEHCVRDRLCDVPHPTLIISGRQDRIVNPKQAVHAARSMPRGQSLVLSACGHAPQIEKAWLVNRLVARFLTQPVAEPALDPRRVAEMVVS